MKQKINTILKGFSKIILFLWGWKIIGTLPKLDKFVAIVAPHRAGTGDVLRGLLVKTIQPIPQVKFPAKYEIMQVPLVGRFLKWLGGIPVDRRHEFTDTPKGFVTNVLINALNSEEKAVVALAPEGTRTVGAEWQRGFYKIALATKAPLVMIAFDYNKKYIWIS
jgi:1-acyl-sn-glycerol-3-phosphate acyltransferase